jgi:ATP-binding protein involved in chromosome partitioning
MTQGPIAEPVSEQNAERPRHIVAVGSGKGGVGKSTVAVNLAVAFAVSGARVGLLDADVHGPDVGVMLGARQRSAPGGAPLLSIGNRAPLRPKARIPAIPRFGVQTFSVGMLIGERQAVRMDGRFAGMLVRQLVEDVSWGPLDVLLIDLPPGTAEPHPTVARELKPSGVVLVTTPQEVARIGTARMLQFYEEANVPVLGTVLNMAYFVCPECGARHVIWPSTAAADDPLGYPVLAELPLAPAIATAGDQGRPIVAAAPESPVARAFMDVAQRIRARIERRPHPPAPSPSPAGL